MKSRMDARAYYEAVSAGDELNDADVADLASQDEGQFLDFKSGKAITSNQSTMLQKVVSAMANAEGGLVVVGVDDTKPRSPLGLETMDDEQLVGWATRVLSPLAPYLTPTPRIRVLGENNRVLAIAVHRAPALVPVIEGNRQRFYLRMGESSVPAPDYLISDLVLGHRRHPVLDVRFNGVQFNHLEGIYDQVSLTISVEITNEGFIPADELQLGVIGWTITTLNNQRELTRALTHAVEVVPTDVQRAKVVVVRGTLHPGIPEGPRLRPFESCSLSAGGSFRLPHPGPHTVRACGAVYITPLGHPPMWYQLEFSLVRDSRTAEVTCGRASLERTAVDLPKVSLSLIRDTQR